MAHQRAPGTDADLNDIWSAPDCTQNPAFHCRVRFSIIFDSRGRVYLWIQSRPKAGLNVKIDTRQLFVQPAFDTKTREPYTRIMEVRFSLEIESRLSEAAANSGHAAEEYVRDLVERYLDEDASFRDAVRSGFAAIDRGDFIDEEAMHSRVERMLRS